MEHIVQSCWRARVPQQLFRTACPIRSGHKLYTYSTTRFSSATAPAAELSPPVDEQALRNGNNATQTSHLTTQMRRFMRHIPHPIAVITSCAPPIAKAPSGNDTASAGNRFMPSFRAMTASSFNSVSMSSDPIISFNSKVPSRTMDSILSRGSFRVTTFISSKLGAQIADSFTRGHAEKAFQRLEKIGVRINYEDSFPYAPRFVGSVVLADLECQLVDKMTINDHVIVVARVLSVNLPNQGPGRLKDSLIYVNGAYRETGAPLFQHESVPEEAISKTPK